MNFALEDGLIVAIKGGTWLGTLLKQAVTFVLLLWMFYVSEHCRFFCVEPFSTILVTAEQENPMGSAVTEILKTARVAATIITFPYSDGLI